MRRRTKRRHHGIYADPIAVGAGEAFHLTGRFEIWDGHRWLWAVAEDGREGWVPDDLPLAGETPDKVVAAYPYSARELDVEPDQSVEVIRTGHGWAWCVDDRGEEGWIPLNVLADS